MSIVSKLISLLSIRIVNLKRAVAFQRVNLAAGEEAELGPTSPLLAGAKNGAPGNRRNGATLGRRYTAPMDELSQSHRFEKDNLLPVERQYLAGEYKKFFLAKRNNFFATLQRLPNLWSCFLLLDEIWYREIADFDSLTNERQAVPLLFYIDAHGQYRSAFELCCSTRQLRGSCTSDPRPRTVLNLMA